MENSIGIKMVALVLCLVAVLSTISCSKDEDLAPPAEIVNTGVIFKGGGSKKATHLVFKIRLGKSAGTEHGQSLKWFSHVELREGPGLIYQIQVYNGTEEVSPRIYTLREGKHVWHTDNVPVSIVKGELTEIFLEWQ